MGTATCRECCHPKSARARNQNAVIGPAGALLSTCSAGGLLEIHSVHVLSADDLQLTIEPSL